MQILDRYAHLGAVRVKATSERISRVIAALTGETTIKVIANCNWHERLESTPAASSS